MYSETLRKLIGKSVKDIYGRYVGKVVGLVVDISGQLKSIGVDEGSGNFVEYHNSRILLDNETLVIVPNWKMDIEKIKRESTISQKRFLALEELSKEGEIPQYVYEEMYKQYSENIHRLQESYKTLTEELKGRIEELDCQREDLEKFLGNVKVQYKTSEIDEETYRVASENVTMMRDRDSKEKDDIFAILNSLSSPETFSEESSVA